MRQFRIIITYDIESYNYITSLQERNEHNGWTIWYMEPNPFDHSTRALVNSHIEFLKSFGISEENIDVKDLAGVWEKV